MAVPGHVSVCARGSRSLFSHHHPPETGEKLWGLLSVVLWVSAMESTDAARCGGTCHNSNFQGTQEVLRIPGLACTKKEEK